MKRRDVEQHLHREGCFVDREGGEHTVYRNPKTGRSSVLPRHTEIKKFVVRDLCRKLGIRSPFD